jgi:arylsulfatase A-like enzyme
MTQPNILLLVMDSARADHLSCYGYHRPTTPNLARIASEGTLYENAFSAAVWTVPSHASFFTGLYPSGHGLYGRNLKLRPDIPTLAEFLQQRGYETAVFTANALVGPSTGLARGFQRHTDVRNLVQTEKSGGWRQRVNALYRRLYYGPRPHRHTWYDNGAWRLNFDLRRWIQSWQKRGEERPFFLFANYMEPHLRYEPPRAYRQAFLTPAQQQQWRRVNQNAWHYMSGAATLDDDDRATLTALYDAELAYLDMRLGQIETFLRRQGLLDDTLLIITADHGENLGDHGLMDHQYCVYDSLARVPLIIRYPARFPVGRRVADLVQTIDLFPTLAGLVDEAGARALPVQGQSLLPEMLASSPREYVVTEYLAPQLHSFRREGITLESAPDSLDNDFFTRRLRALRTRDYKYIWASDGRHELYDLRADPGELWNVIHEPRQQATAVALADQLQQWVVTHTSDNTSHHADPLDETIIRHLAALGYIEA